MRYDPNEPTPPAAPVPKTKRAPKLVHTPAMKAFAGLSNAMLQIMAPCSPQDVDQVRADFLAHLAATQDTDWRSAWQTWRSAQPPATVPRSEFPVPSSDPVPSAPFPLCPPAPPAPRSDFPVPSSPHPWLVRLQQRRRQLGLALHDPNALAIA